MKTHFLGSLIVLICFVLGCTSEAVEKPALNTVELTRYDSTRQMNALLEELKQEAISGMRTASEQLEKDGYQFNCEPRNEFNIRMNNRGELLIQKDPASLEEIPDAVHLFYTANRDLTDQEMRQQISNSNYSCYNFPFYSTITQADIEAAIEIEQNLAKAAKDVENWEIYAFYKQQISEWESYRTILNMIGRKELKLPRATPILIGNRSDSSGFSLAADQALLGMYKVRNTASLDYFGMSYLDLYLRFKRMSTKEFQQQMDALKTIHPIDLFDESFLNAEGLYSPYFLRTELIAPPK